MQENNHGKSHETPFKDTYFPDSIKKNNSKKPSNKIKYSVKKEHYTIYLEESLYICHYLINSIDGYNFFEKINKRNEKERD